MGITRITFGELSEEAGHNTLRDLAIHVGPNAFALYCYKVLKQSYDTMEQARLDAALIARAFNETWGLVVETDS